MRYTELLPRFICLAYAVSAAQLAFAQTPRFSQQLLDQMPQIVSSAQEMFDVPGGAIALIEGGRVVYARGFGFRNCTTGAPFTPDTVFRIASTSKAMTSMLVATQVDQGLFGWDTPVRAVSPALRFPNESLSSQVTVRQMMGMGTGLGENPIELYADLYSPEYMLKELASLPVISPPGLFHYNNTVYAWSGYLGSLKRGVPIADLLESYAAEMKRQLFVPMRMETTAVTDNPASVSGNFSVSYGYDLGDGTNATYRLPFEPIRAAAPAGAVCTTLNDMSRYLIAQLNRGVAPDGTRVVSAANIEETWKPQTPMGGAASYAMGWITANLRGLRILNHAGSADAFKTDVTLLPDAGLGILIFSNNENGELLNSTLRTYLIDSITGTNSTAFEDGQAAYDKQKKELRELRSSITSLTVDRSAVAGFLGQYEKGWTVEHQPDNTFWLTRLSGYRLALFPTAGGFLVGSTNDLAGFGALAKFTVTNSGVVRLALSRNGQTIDTMARISAPPNPVSAITADKLKIALQQMESHARDAMTKTGLPGLAIGVVYKDEVVYLNGIGVREAGATDRVDADTVFQLASLSNPITSTVAAGVVGKGLASWEDPIVKHDPGFKMYDPWVTERVTIRDLLSHRSGLAGNAGNDLEELGFTQDQILPRIHLAKPIGPFRAYYSYSNFGLTQARVATAKAAGKSWEDLSDDLYRRLGMTSTSSRYKDFVARGNRASLHIPVQGRWTPLLIRDADPQSPAGGASSNVRDLVQWLRLHLRDGVLEGEPVIGKDALTATREPIILKGVDPNTGGPSFYGLGWSISYDESGKPVYSHAGTFSHGARTMATLVPADDLGIVVLANAFPTGVPEAVSQALIDLAKYGTIQKDWLTIWNEIYASPFAQWEDADGAYRKFPATRRPSLPLETYLGKYRNEYVGDLEVRVSDGKLTMLLGPARKPFPLEPWDLDLFVSKPYPEAPDYPVPVTFTIGPGQMATDLMVQSLEDANGQGRFLRAPSPGFGAP